MKKSGFSAAAFAFVFIRDIEDDSVLAVEYGAAISKLYKVLIEVFGLVVNYCRPAASYCVKDAPLICKKCYDTADLYFIACLAAFGH